MCVFYVSERGVKDLPPTIEEKKVLLVSANVDFTFTLLQCLIACFKFDGLCFSCPHRPVPTSKTVFSGNVK